jgi:hypothetical protein
MGESLIALEDVASRTEIADDDFIRIIKDMVFEIKEGFRRMDG